MSRYDSRLNKCFVFLRYAQQAIEQEMTNGQQGAFMRLNKTAGNFSPSFILNQYLNFISPRNCSCRFC